MTPFKIAARKLAIEAVLRSFPFKYVNFFGQEGEWWPDAIPSMNGRTELCLWVGVKLSKSGLVSIITIGPKGRRKTQRVYELGVLRQLLKEAWNKELDEARKVAFRCAQEALQESSEWSEIQQRLFRGERR